MFLYVTTSVPSLVGDSHWDIRPRCSRLRNNSGVELDKKIKGTDTFLGWTLFTCPAYPTVAEQLIAMHIDPDFLFPSKVYQAVHNPEWIPSQTAMRPQMNSKLTLPSGFQLVVSAFETSLSPRLQTMLHTAQRAVALVGKSANSRNSIILTALIFCLSAILEFVHWRLSWLVFSLLYSFSHSSSRERQTLRWWCQPMTRKLERAHESLSRDGIPNRLGSSAFNSSGYVFLPFRPAFSWTKLN